MKTKNAMLIAAVLGAFACSTADTYREGIVVSKVGQDEAKVHMRHVQLKEGDRVVLSKDMCTLKPVAGDSPAEVQMCDKVKVGEAKVVKVLNAHETVIRTDGTSIEVGTVVEKI